MMNKLAVVSMLTLTGCAVHGPLRMKETRLNVFGDIRQENSEILCYTVGGLTTCKWKSPNAVPTNIELDEPKKWIVKK